MMVRGPRTLRWAVQRLGGRTAAAKACGVSTMALGRWLSMDMRKAPSHHSLWAGYPSPFPMLDRIIEELDDDGPDSYLGRLAEKTGTSNGVFDALHQGFGLSLLDMDTQQVVDLASRTSVPLRTAYTLMDGLSYPRSWEALDSMARSLRECRWLELVLNADSSMYVPRMVAKEAMSVMIKMIF